MIYTYNVRCRESKTLRQVKTGLCLSEFIRHITIHGIMPADPIGWIPFHAINEITLIGKVEN